jgi:nucleoside-diphosphate-sugar epimerase
MHLVTGGAGFIGSHLVKHLTSREIPVRCLVRRSTPLHFLDPANVELLYGDLVTGEGLQAAFQGVTTVFHVAGTVHAISWQEYLQGNAQATANAVSAALDAGVQRFVHVSSISAVGPSPEGEVLTEEAVPHPISPYGRSKLAAEEAVLHSALRERSVIVRPPPVYGPRDTGLFGFFRAVTRGRIPQVGRAEKRFNLVFVKDLVAGLTAASHGAKNGEIFFLAHPPPVSWASLGMAAANVMRRNARSVHFPQRLATTAGLAAEIWSRITGRPGMLNRGTVRESAENWVCDTTKAQKNIGFVCRTSLEDGLVTTLSWYKDAGWLDY